ncbi:MAG TPA: hypothetical protein VFF26_12715 [Gallionella sp.]|nr:hypothetical protein [Gallionella sp.]
MIRNPIDISSRVSPELSNLIENIVNYLETDEPITLSMVKSFIENDLPIEFSEAEEMHHFDVDESVVDELDELIEGFGESAAAVDFIHAFASEALSRVIETVAGEESRENPLTLGEVRDELASGLAGRLVGEGVLDEEEDDVLMPELDALIRRFGDDATAEDFLRYE